jgi:hypothetical protein
MGRVCASDVEVMECRLSTTETMVLVLDHMLFAEMLRIPRY